MPGLMKHITGQASQRILSSILAVTSSMSASLAGKCDGRDHAIGRRGYLANARAGRMMDRVENGRRRGDQRLFANALGAERADGRSVLHKNGFDRRHVADRRDEIIMQVLALAGEELFHQRHPEALRRAALDLTLDQSRVD